MLPKLEFPDFAWKEGSLQNTLEVSIDFLPSIYEGRWLDVVRESTAEWVRSTAFAKRGTIWMWGSISSNFQIENKIPSWSEFIVSLGFPASFNSHLYSNLSKSFQKNVRFSETLQLRRDDGWSPVCHVEKRTSWRQEDADLWVPYEKKAAT